MVAMNSRLDGITPNQITPVVPSLERNLQPLREKAAAVIAAAAQMPHGALPYLKAELTPRLRAMNSYYSNKIEGQHTTPLLLERALQQDYSAKPDEAGKQRLALVHMAAEEQGERQIQETGWCGGRERYSAATLQDIHALIYRQLNEADRTQDLIDLAGNSTGKQQIIHAGMLRDLDVGLGRHIPPPHEKISEFLDFLEQYYQHSLTGETGLITLLAAHHRYAWVRPFADGNGRTLRLHTHFCLQAMHLTHGLWSPMRGFARRQPEYYRYLAAADQPRQGDQDGRGNLSEAGLCAWIDFALDVCLDQIQFMSSRLRLDDVKQRLAMFLAAQAQRESYGDIRPEVIKPVLYVMALGPISRAEFKAMTGLAERTAERALAAILKLGLLGSPTPKGALHIRLSPLILSGMFPQLWPELDADLAGNGG